MQPTTLAIDHSFLRHAVDGRHRDEFRWIGSLVEAGRVQFIASVFHLFEISRHPDHASNLNEARLIDSLQPKWLRWPRDLIAAELLNAFHHWRGDKHHICQILPFVQSPSQQLPGGQIRLIDPRATSAEGLVRYLQVKPEERMKAVLAAREFTDYRSTLQSLTDASKRDARSFRLRRDSVARSMIRNLAPERDRDGNFTRAAEREAFAKKIDLLESPTLATECALFDFKLRRPFLPDASEEWDMRFAVSALPYVDVTVVDRQFSDLVRQAAKDSRAIRSYCTADLASALRRIENKSPPTAYEAPLA